MSTDPELARQLRDAERGEAAAYTEHRFPTWLAPVTALWAGSASVGLIYADPSLSLWWVLAHLVLAWVYQAWDFLTRRNAPSSRSPMPREYWWPTAILVAGMILVAVLAALADSYVNGATGVLVTVVGAYAVLQAYLGLYTRASRTIRERLA